MEECVPQVLSLVPGFLHWGCLLSSYKEVSISVEMLGGSACRLVLSWLFLGSLSGLSF